MDRGRRRKGKTPTSGRDGVEADTPWYAKGRETLDQTNHRGFTAQVRVSRAWVPEETRRARRRNDLAFAALIATVVALVEQLQKGEDGVVERGAVEPVRGRELVHGRLPRMRDKVAERGARFQVLEHGAGHAGVGDEDVNVADFETDAGGDCVQVVF